MAAKNGNGDKESGLFIRIAESRIYEGEPVLKALLKEVCFMSTHDWHEGDNRIPRGSPYTYKEYDGWCYGGQKYGLVPIFETPS
jgi:hypothetical protein